MALVEWMDLSASSDTCGTFCAFDASSQCASDPGTADIACLGEEYSLCRVNKSGLDLMIRSSMRACLNGNFFFLFTHLTYLLCLVGSAP